MIFPKQRVKLSSWIRQSFKNCEHERLPYRWFYPLRCSDGKCLTCVMHWRLGFDWDFAQFPSAQKSGNCTPGKEKQHIPNNFWPDREGIAKGKLDNKATNQMLLSFLEGRYTKSCYVKKGLKIKDGGYLPKTNNQLEGQTEQNTRTKKSSNASGPVSNHLANHDHAWAWAWALTKQVGTAFTLIMQMTTCMNPILAQTFFK